jgi:hypothetical protein
MDVGLPLKMLETYAKYKQDDKLDNQVEMAKFGLE